MILWSFFSNKEILIQKNLLDFEAKRFDDESTCVIMEGLASRLPQTENNAAIVYFVGLNKY